MRPLHRLLMLEFWFLVWLPVLGGFLVYSLNIAGIFIFLFLLLLWGWQLFAYNHYRFMRQEEFLYVLKTAADTQAPVEPVLTAYLIDRPQGDAYRFWVSTILTFVIPGFYWVHKQRSYDVRLKRLAAMLRAGAPLTQALRLSPGVVSREIALAITVGQFSGKLSQALSRLPDRRLALQWLELAPRFGYPLLILAFTLANVSFLTVFIIPKLEKIFQDFKLQLPAETLMFVSISRSMSKYAWLVIVFWIVVIVLFNLAMLSSRFKWYFPFFGGLYRLYARGQFLHVLGVMLQTGRPLPEILGCVVESRLLPNVIASRVRELMRDLADGQPLADSLVRQGLATESAKALIVSAERANNLPWALEELGESMTRRCATWSYRICMSVFPLIIFACSVLVACVAISMFQPLVSILDGLSTQLNAPKGE